MTQPLVIGGFVPFSTVDFPGALAAVLFCQGCSWTCSYCQSPRLQPMGPSQTWEDVRDDLRRRRGLLEAVVFSGGEPQMQSALKRALAEVRIMGFQTGLHTGGCHPEHLEKLLPSLDWVGLEIKAPRHRYPAITGSPDSGDRAWTSLARLRESGIRHEVRTTWHPKVLPEEALLELASHLTESGIREWVIQASRPEIHGDEALTPGLLDALGKSFTGRIHVRSRNIRSGGWKSNG